MAQTTFAHTVGKTSGCTRNVPSTRNVYAADRARVEGTVMMMIRRINFSAGKMRRMSRDSVYMRCDEGSPINIASPAESSPRWRGALGVGSAWPGWWTGDMSRSGCTSRFPRSLTRSRSTFSRGASGHWRDAGRRPRGAVSRAARGAVGQSRIRGSKVSDRGRSIRRGG